MANESVIEVQRKLHEERERIEGAIAKEMFLRKSNVRVYCIISLCIYLNDVCRFVIRSIVSIVSETCVIAH